MSFCDHSLACWLPSLRLAFSLLKVVTCLLQKPFELSVCQKPHSLPHRYLGASKRMRLAKLVSAAVGHLLHHQAVAGTAELHPSYQYPHRLSHVVFVWLCLCLRLSAVVMAGLVQATD